MYGVAVELWIGFIAFVLMMLAIDLGLFHRKAHAVRFGEALGWSAVWVSLALLFNLGVWSIFGAERGIEFLTGYLIEWSLSVDNIFVFLVIFSSLGVPAVYQHRVLFWGIVSALVLRALMIFGGTALLARFHWLIYVFGGFLIVTGVKILLQREKEMQPEAGLIFRIVQRVIPSTPRYDGERFFTRLYGKTVATPLFTALILIEISDVIFALDSIPAIFAVTRDPFIVFTSNIFAILGLRSMFFVLAVIADRFRYLKIGLSCVLVFVGTKMTIVELYKIPALVSLGVVFSILAVSIAASWLAGRAGGPRLGETDA
jgi:tellurite resistance protein TerC